MDKVIPQQTSGDWEREFDESFGKDQYGGKMAFRQDLVKPFIRNLLASHQEEMVKKADEEITKLLHDFANTKIEERGTGWDWLIKLRQAISLLSKGV